MKYPLSIEIEDTIEASCFNAAVSKAIKRLARGEYALKANVSYMHRPKVSVFDAIKPKRKIRLRKNCVHARPSMCHPGYDCGREIKNACGGITIRIDGECLGPSCGHYEERKGGES